MSLFDPERPDPVLLRPGDTVRFRPISREEFGILAGGRAG
jgi:allophanate hydrolase subunit 1